MFQMNLSNVDMIERSLSSASLSSCYQKEISEEYGWIDKMPDNLHFALNINQVYTKKIPENLDRIVKLQVWLECEKVPITSRVERILLRRQCDEELTVWQLDTFDELISMEVPVCILGDVEIKIACEIRGVDGHVSGLGSVNIYEKDSGILKSGLLTLTMNASDKENLPEIKALEDACYRRKSKQVPTWHIQLMKERLVQLKVDYLESHPQGVIVNFILPIPSYPLRVRSRSEGYDGETDDLCSWDVMESQEDARVRRKYSHLFVADSGKIISNGDLRLIHLILQRGFDNAAVDSANLLWNRREYLSTHFPSAIVPFIQSVQWWLSASDPSEIDEALRVIEGWRLGADSEENEEILAILLVKMSKITGLSDSPTWLNLFTKLLPVNPVKFVKSYQSAIILFITRGRSNETPALQSFIKRRLLFEAVGKDVGLASELYWRFKSGGNDDLFEEYVKGLGEEEKDEIRKQERLFKAIEDVLMTAQRFKGPRTGKLELLKKLIGDPEGSEIPSATQLNPILPGLEATTETRIRAVVPDRCNLFKSTAFTVLLVFLREKAFGDRAELSLPIIFKKGDDLGRDAGCLRIFRAIWDIWQREGGLELFPRRLLYGVVPLGKDFGLVEFVESVPLSRVIVQEVNNDSSAVAVTNEWAISRYLSDLPDGPGAKRRFLASCVGFSLVTYLLGIGDRHLDNLLLTPEGHLLHIDFSFLFGADPKPFPPPIKMTREMVRGFEEDSDDPVHGWNEFKGLCFTALTLLRRKSKVLVSLIEAEYPTAEIEFVKERLALMVVQAEALQKFDRLLEESRGAMFPQVMETIHKWVQYWKS